MITPSRFKGSGPKNELNTPGAEDTDGSLTWDKAFNAPMNPPLMESTAPIMATIPKIMMMPWMKSFMAVAIYPPAMT